MKIVPIAVFLFLAYSRIAFCPNLNTLLIVKSEPIIEVLKLTTAYDKLIDAIFNYESGRNPNAYNKKEGAVGGLQIRQCRIDHYNELTGKNYTLDEMYDFDKAKEVFLHFAKGKSYEQAAKNWNGSGPMTIDYWNHVQPLIKI